MRQMIAFGLAAGLLLSACARPVPNSAVAPVPQGVGFGDYASYELDRARREAAMTGAPPGALVAAPTQGFPAVVPVAAAPLAGSPTLAPLNPAPPSGISTTDLAAAGIGGAGSTPAPLAADGALAYPVAQASPPPVGATIVSGDYAATSASMPAPITASDPALVLASATTPAATPTTGGTSAIFGEGVRLGATEIAPGSLSATSESRPEWNPAADPLRDHGLEAQPGNAAPVLVDAPVAQPAADAGPNIVEYALAAPNARGQEAYSRFAFSGQGRAARNCADYRSPDEAQRDFLARGGPTRDSRGLDPDGDGFACAWDPAPFRAALGR